MRCCRLCAARYCSQVWRRGSKGYCLDVERPTPPDTQSTQPLTINHSPHRSQPPHPGRALSHHLNLAARPGPPLFYTWPEAGGRGDPYLGAAHGLTGIVHALLHCWRLLSAQERADLIATCDYILSLETSVPGRPVTGGHWPVMCHFEGRRMAAAGQHEATLGECGCCSLTRCY